MGGEQHPRLHCGHQGEQEADQGRLEEALRCRDRDLEHPHQAGRLQEGFRWSSEAVPEERYPAADAFTVRSVGVSSECSRQITIQSIAMHASASLVVQCIKCFGSQNISPLIYRK